MTSPDIRAGVSLLLAALAADGESTIHNVEQIDRGYQNIDTRLNVMEHKHQKNCIIINSTHYFKNSFLI